MLACTGGISFISHAECLTIGLLMDKSAMKSPIDLMEIFYKHFDLLFGSTEWRNFNNEKSRYTSSEAK